MITLKTSSFKRCIDDIEPLFYEMHREVEPLAVKYRLDPDYERYQIMDDNGYLRIHVVMDDDKAVGFLVSVLGPHLHHKDVVYAFSDVLYLLPDYRDGWTKPIAVELLEYAEQDLKENMKVDVFVVGMKVKHEFRELLKYRGFGLQEELWEKVL